MINQFIHKPKEVHLQAVLKYKGYSSIWRVHMFKRNNQLTIEAYTDVDYVEPLVHRRSAPGYHTLLGGNLVMRRNKKQNMITWSNAESEFWQMAHGVSKLLWLKMILEDLKLNGNSQRDSTGITSQQLVYRTTGYSMT